jgi:hypothetical protein
MPTIKVNVVADVNSLNRGLSAAGRGIKGLSLSFGQLAKSVLVVDAVQKAVEGLNMAVHLGIEEFADSAKVQAQTQAALKATGGVANVTNKQINDLSMTLSNLSGVDDETVKSGENVLLTFRAIRNQVGKNNDIFTQATKAALDWSVRAGKPMSVTALALGKALEDPARKVVGLARAGVVFTQQQVKQIKAMQLSGNVIGAQKFILDQFRQRMEGAAAAAGKTLPGQLNIMRDRLKDIAGVLVGAAVPAVTRFTKILTAWATDPRTQQQAQQIAQAVGEKLGKALENVVSFLSAHKDDLKTFFESALAVIGNVANLIEGVSKALLGLSDAIGSQKKQLEVMASAWVLWKIGALKQIATIVAANIAGAETTAAAWRAALIATGWGAILVAVGAIAIDKFGNATGGGAASQFPPGVSGPVGKPSGKGGVGPPGPVGPVGTTLPTFDASQGLGATGGLIPPKTIVGEPKWKKAFDLAVQRLQLSVSKAGLTSTLADDIAATKKLVGYLSQESLLHKNDLDIQGQLVDAQKSLNDLKRQQVDLDKQAAQARKDEASAIKSSVLALLGRKQTFKTDERAITDAMNALKLARIIGGPQGILKAQQALSDARYQRTVDRISNASASLGAPNGSGAEAFRLGSVTINVNGAMSPDQVAEKVLEKLGLRHKKQVAAQPRGRFPGGQSRWGWQG